LLRRVAGAAALRKALAELNHDDRELLTLIAWDGLSPAQAAVVIGCSAAAVRPGCTAPVAGSRSGSASIRDPVLHGNGRRGRDRFRWAMGSPVTVTEVRDE
jgi:Sigma-70, region 4